jgi:hypothetical protein
MMVLSTNKCKKCNYTCNAIHFQQNFKSWTSGNDNIDKLIQETQLSVHKDTEKVLEWISYNRFYNIKYIEKIGVYNANWIDGSINFWYNYNQNWQRTGQNKVVSLKSLNNTIDVELKLTNEV